MVFAKKIDDFTKGKMLTLYEDCGLKVSEIQKKCPSVSRASIYRIINKKNVNISTPKKKMGRPLKFTKRNEREVMRTVKTLRRKNVNFSAKDVHERSGCTHVSYRTIVRTMNKHGFNHLQSRKKGLVTEKDRSMRIKFAKDMLQHHTEQYWKSGVAFYLDGIGLVHKTNPMEETRAPKARVWRKKSEGLQITSKGKKAGYGGKVANFIVCISYGKGVVYCEPYQKMNGAFFASVINNDFDSIIKACEKDSRVFVQDGDPSQNSKLAKLAMERCNVVMQAIPARSPDINPIENVFHIVKREMEKDAIGNNIERESFKELVCRAKNVMTSIPHTTIDNIISSMHARMTSIINAKGHRLRY